MRCALVVMAACGAAPVPSKPVPTPHAAAPLAFRQVRAIAGHAQRTSFELTLEGDRATLVETEARAGDANGPWQTASTRSYRGSRRGAELELATDDMQPLALHCESQSIAVAAAGAAACGSAAARTVQLDAFTCTAAGQSAADTDDDDRLVFAPAPGIEWVELAADCGGLRIASP